MKNIFLAFMLFANLLLLNAQTKTVIYFDSNKSELKPSAVKSLDSLVGKLKTATFNKIIISGYCDSKGDDISNQMLSEKRANTVANYFKSKNIQGDFITKGFGETNPISSNNNDEGKAKNRRVEIQIFIVIATSASAPVAQDKETFNEKSSLSDLEVGKTLVLKNLNFEGGTAVLLPEAKPTLAMLLKTMKDNPTLEIEIGGHVCCADDMPLSVLRAKSVYNYLLSNGIDAMRMTYKGYSRNKPIVEDDRNEVNARLNRRVEITILKK
jgi:outer membrane protein OmpA-like peptidoglycan-associated protein